MDKQTHCCRVEDGIAHPDAAAQQRREYESLIAAGVPEVSARRMSGCLAAPVVSNA